jgi:LysM repeat protein
MSKRCIVIFFIVFASIALVYQPLAAKEDTAQIKLKKTAISKKNLYTYTVKEGDSLATIIKNIPSIAEKDLSSNYQLIRELNPDLPNLEELEVGQSIILPGKPLNDAEENEVENTAVSPANFSSSGRVNYKIKRGDTLYKIIRRELKLAETNIPSMLRTIKSINPGIKNVNKIYAGTVIKLPGKTVFAKTPEEFKPVTQEMTKASEKSTQPEKILEVKKTMPPEARLALLKQVITQMNGTVTTTGNYYFPIPQAGQVTIDCSKIPVIEFDDNTTVFLDLENRANNNLKKMISSNWKNYSLV